MSRRTLALGLALAATLTGCGADQPQAPTAASRNRDPEPSGNSGGDSGSDPSPNTAVAMELVHEPGFELVLTYCVTCHGPRQFLQQRGDRETWLGLIRWMQKDHGMQPLPDGVEDPLVDYLAKHYGPEHQGRRKPLRSDLLPPNPYGR